MNTIASLWFMTLIVLYADDTMVAEISVPVGGFESEAHCFAFSDGMDIEVADGHTVMISCELGEGWAR